ncbi:MAG TPA: FAD-dependent oxidoreductase [Vitreimonas sp.]|uniref:NAD(P)/FAD-dependent oxidoreductase n=1 Tax=Vitreimonas sp. TaxID=3069702 RepID=UPI002D3E5D16|nr:FAD-dependent oxidoreductase [Vitreimonas sp.]HYD88287.1 FAD-dependent oxidoreductase [Vitreimonas sp.]
MKRVVIVGGGVIGLSCAVRLRQGGAQVTLLEAESEHPSVFGPTASAAAAGMLAPLERGTSAHERLMLDSFELWRSRRSGAEWADGARFDGAVVMNGNAEEAAAFQRNAERLGREATPISPGQFVKRTGLNARVENAVFVLDEGVADPLRVLTGLAMQARAMGVLIEFDTDVASVSANAAVAHDDRTFEADAIVLAPGAWATEKIMNAAPALKRVQASKGHLVEIELPRPLGATVRGGDFYIAQRREDVVLGATMELGRHDRAVDKALTADLAAKAERALPGAFKTSGRAWAGIRPMSPDGWPMIGLDGDGLFIAAGHGRNGWLLAPITAEIISAYVFGAEIAPDWAALSPARFGTA